MAHQQHNTDSNWDRLLQSIPPPPRMLPRLLEILSEEPAPEKKPIKLSIKGEPCTICLDDMFDDGTRAKISVLVLSCGHFLFHRRCLSNWIIQTSTHECPLCRQSLEPLEHKLYWVDQEDKWELHELPTFYSNRSEPRKKNILGNSIVHVSPGGLVSLHRRVV
ncbi:hypothetical protein QBC41DRAFT_125274 [Cercophora samala]|uniref:RING-type domain-containing protein n=1 Tax=Cercophora samala TaxID=330535 RepID=A0AA40DFS4_9PEZI|nr:hypothetical protein QBC41DRAFT_125274 [Cercophora samala]